MLAASSSAIPNPHPMSMSSPKAMELLRFAFHSVSFLLSISFLLIFINGWKRSRQLNAKHKQPPGPWNIPILGSIHHLIGSIPHRVLRDLSRKHGPLMHLKLGELPFIVISSPRLAKEILRTHDLVFASRPRIQALEIIFYNNSDIIFSPYGEHWRQMRKICVLELFSLKRVRSFGPIRWDEGSRLIASIQTSAGKPINLTEKLISYTNSMVSRTAFGKVCRDLDTVAKLMKEVEKEGTFSLADLFPSSRILPVLCGSKSKVLKIHHEFDMMLNDIINEHIKNLETTKKGNGEFGEEDIVDILLKIKESGDLGFPLTNGNIKGVLLDIFVGGIETSSTTAVWAMSELMRKPHVMTKAQREIREALKGKKTIDEADIQGLDYLKFVIKETLRLHPPGPLLIPRECREDCEIDGYHIPMGTRVIINAWAIGTDEEHWSDPERFIPERFENNPVDFLGNHYEYVPFGSGRRMCPGASFGLANVKLPLALLLYHFNWKLPDGLNPEDLDMLETTGLACPRKNDLRLVPTLYDPSL